MDNMQTQVLSNLAELLRARQEIDREIANLVGRPAQIGHIGEYIAAAVFGIELNRSASMRGHDGVFVAGPLDGRTVNIKWYSKLEGLLDLNPLDISDFCLVLAGPRANGASSRGTHRPWVISSVHLFEGEPLHTVLRGRGVRIGIATSVGRAMWDAAEIYPEPRSPLLSLDAIQKRLLGLFAPRV